MVKPSGIPFDPPINNLLMSLLDGINDLTYNGEEIALVFKTKPDRKTPDYYKIIQNPISLGMIRTNLRKGRYPHPRDYLRDLAQLVWNAKTYNAKESLVYNYAGMIEDFIKTVIIPTMRTDPKLNKYGHNYEYPYLGPLPEEFLNSQGVAKNKNSQVPPSPRRESKPSTSNGSSHDSTPLISSAQSTSYTNKHGSITPQPSNGYNNDLTYEAWCKRGRPPIIDRPYEQRIKSIMKSIKKVKNEHGEYVHLQFDRVPDSKDYPDYYSVIRDPMSLDLIKLKVRQRSYSNVDQFVDDLNLMFNNVKTFHPADSKIVTDAYLLQRKAREFIEEETKKPDTAFLVSDGSHSMRIPIDELEVKGKTYKVGDWILVRNPNDENKPIVAQLFRMWKTQDGKKWINVCWYYRPEQTVHRVDRLFYPNEVCKSGQYRDHLAEEIVGKCYVAYFTRYQRGDPGVQYEGPLFVCEFRYNDTDKGFNKIRTWKACLPDEVRHVEDPIIPLKSLRVMPKIESPLKHLLPPNASYDDPIPDPTLGYANAPPLIGAVYRRPPDPKDDLGQYSTSMNPNKNNIPKNISNVKNITNVPLPQSNAGVYSYPSTPNSPGYGKFSLTSGAGASTNQASYPNQVRYNQNNYSSRAAIHHASSNYGVVSTNYAYTLPHELDQKLGTSVLYRVDKSLLQKSLGPTSELLIKEEEKNEPQVSTVWYCAPPTKIISRIHTSELMTLGSLLRPSRKREFPVGKDSETGTNKSRRDRRSDRKSIKDEPAKSQNHNDHFTERVVDSPAYGYIGLWSVNHTSKYIAWRREKQKAKESTAKSII